MQNQNENAQDLATVCSFPAECEKVETLLVKAEQLQVLESNYFLQPTQDAFLCVAEMIHDDLCQAHIKPVSFS